MQTVDFQIKILTKRVFQIYMLMNLKFLYIRLFLRLYYKIENQKYIIYMKSKINYQLYYNIFFMDMLKNQLTLKMEFRRLIVFW